MEKLLLFLTLLFFTITSLFYVFLTKFNEARRANINFSPKVAGATIVKQKPTVYVSPTPKPTEELIPTPTAIPETIYSIPIGQMQIASQIIFVSAIKTYLAGSPTPTPNSSNPTDIPKIPFNDFQIKLAFPKKINPGSTDNKFIFENAEYELKVFSGDTLLNQIMYKIVKDYIIINHESGIWQVNAKYEVGIYVDGNKIDEVKFSIE